MRSLRQKGQHMCYLNDPNWSQLHYMQLKDVKRKDTYIVGAQKSG